MSVIFSCEGIELRWTFWGCASRSASVSRPKADAPAAALPMDVKNERRSSRRSTAGFIAPPLDPEDGPGDGVFKTPATTAGFWWR
jgi:hypothetical protein